jgi:hypothetical protein
MIENRTNRIIPIVVCSAPNHAHLKWGGGQDSGGYHLPDVRRTCSYWCISQCSSAPLIACILAISSRIRVLASQALSCIVAPSYICKPVSGGYNIRPFLLNPAPIFKGI